MTLFAKIAILNLAFWTIYPKNGILITFPMTVIMHFLRNYVIILGFFFIWIFTKRVQRCKEDCLPRFVTFFSTQNQSARQDKLNAPWTTSVKILLFPVARNIRVWPSVLALSETTRVPWIARSSAEEFLVIHLVFNSFLTPSFFNKLNPIFSDKFGAPCFPNAFSNTGRTVSQCYDPSGSRSYWS